MNKTELLLDVVEKLDALSGSLKDLAKSISSDDTQEKSKPKKVESKQTITLEDVRAVLAEKSRDGKTSQVKELITKFGADKLSAINSSHYAEILKEGEKL